MPTEAMYLKFEKYSSSELFSHETWNLHMIFLHYGSIKHNELSGGKSVVKQLPKSMFSVDTPGIIRPDFVTSYNVFLW